MTLIWIYNPDARLPIWHNVSVLTFVIVPDDLMVNPSSRIVLWVRARSDNLIYSILTAEVADQTLHASVWTKSLCCSSSSIFHVTNICTFPHSADCGCYSILNPHGSMIWGPSATGLNPDDTEPTHSILSSFRQFQEQAVSQPHSWARI